MPSRISYAVGDIHGRFDLLKMALGAVDRHIRAHGQPSQLIFLGDYVDRGPESRQVVEALMTLSAGEDCVCLKGNHEELMVEALTHARRGAYARWCANGGRETLVSYGVSDTDHPEMVVPAEHVRWLTNLPLVTTDEHRIFVHAGLSPRKPLEEQSEAACLWIRERFLRAPARDFDRHVVHGHTPLWEGKPAPSEPEVLEHRTNLDTAAFASGILTIGVFDEAVPGGPVEVLSVRGQAYEYVVDEADDVAEDTSPEPPSLFRRIRDRLRAAVG